MTQLNYGIFYKQYGIRRIQDLLSPKLINITSLPRNSILHVTNYDSQHPDLDASKLLYRGYNKKILVDMVEELTENSGSPRHKNILIKSLSKDFFITNKEFKYSKDHYKNINDPQTLLVINYGYLDSLYKYIDLPLAKYYQWHNDQKTMWDNINKVCNESSRNNFINIPVPDIIPSYSLLNIYKNKVNQSTLKVFDSPDKLFILELWKWLEIDTKSSSIMSSIETKNLNKINLIFINSSGTSAVLNLGYLNSFIKGSVNTTEFNNIMQLPSTQIQKIFLRFVISLDNKISEDSLVDTSDIDNTIKDNKELINDQEDRQLQSEIDDISSDYESSSNDLDPASDYQDYLKLDPEMKEPESEVILDEEDFLTKELDSVDEDLKILEKINISKFKDHGILETSEGITDNVINELTVEDIHKEIFANKDFDVSLKEQIDSYAEYGLLSASDYKKLIKDIDNYKSMKDPYGSKKTLIEAMQITKEDIQLDTEKTNIVASDNVLDKNMLQASLLSFDQDYINNVLHKDILSMVSGLQKSGVVIKKHEIEKDNSALGEYEIHSLELKPIDGVASTVRFRLPVIREDGTFISNGNKYILRKQKIDQPIRKIDPTTVALTSYYGKNFVTLSQKTADSSLEWLKRQINKISLQENSYITKLAPANVFDNKFAAPFIYNALATVYKSFRVDKLNLIFDNSLRLSILEMYDPALSITDIEKDGKIIAGISFNKELIVVDSKNEFHLYSQAGIKNLGTIYDILKLPENEAPVDFTEVRIFSKTVPVGLVLGYFLGFKNLLKFLNVRYRVVEGRKNKALLSTEYALTFKNESYIFSKKDLVASLILGGFVNYEKQLKQYLSEDFDTKDVYMNLLTSKGLGSLYIRELELSDQLFVDSITKSILEELGEPTTFKGLLLRSTEMLTYYHHHDSQDMAVMRIRGYERLAGFIYKELSSSIRQYRNRNIAGKSRIELNPFQVWQSIMTDQSKKMIEDINPIQNLKEVEVITYLGSGGRSKESMSKKSRTYHAHDMGVVSEANIDSGDVGINAYLSSNPRFKNLRGITISDGSEITSSSLLSTSSMLAPGVHSDDPKRISFIGIQNSHSIATEGYHQSIVRTGYEYVLPNRTTEMFAYTAKQDGKVISKTKTGIIIEYKDGSKKGIAIGRIYGKAEGSVYPHDIVTDLDIGDNFSKGDPLVYNTGFFEKDSLDPKRIVYKTSMVVKTALLETNQTHEDSSSISSRLSDRLTAKTTKIKSLVIDFNQNLINMVKPGQKVSPKDILVLIEDEITSTTSSFDEESLAILRKFSKQAPTAKYHGIVDRIEVLYHGDKEDMSASLLALADRSDKQLAESNKSTNQSIITGRVNSEYRVKGVPLADGKAEIKIYITIQTKAGVGDKVIAANQMKSVVGEVLDYDIKTTEGEDIDFVFSYRSIAARIVLSPIIIGTTTTLLRVLGKKAVQIYRGS